MFVVNAVYRCLDLVLLFSGKNLLSMTSCNGDLCLHVKEQISYKLGKLIFTIRLNILMPF